MFTNSLESASAFDTVGNAAPGTDLDDVFRTVQNRFQEFHATLIDGQEWDAQQIELSQAILCMIDPDLQAQADERVETLCHNQQFAQAAPIAAVLSACEPDNSRRSYMAAFCQQNLDQHHLALELYSISQLGAQPSASTCYRIGECHSSLGDWEKAVEAFDACIELARADHSSHTLYAMALQSKEHAQAQLGSTAEVSTQGRSTDHAGTDHWQHM